MICKSISSGIAEYKDKCTLRNVSPQSKPRLSCACVRQDTARKAFPFIIMYVEGKREKGKETETEKEKKVVNFIADYWQMSFVVILCGFCCNG